ncbi:MAG: hypothetical protein AAGC60_25735 [Acidobacteriota bacterium]
MHDLLFKLQASLSPLLAQLEAFLPGWLSHPDVWKYASIPVLAGIVGWATNWAAIELTFKPLRFIGIRPFLGWQGIIPAKAGRMATIFVDSTMSKLGTLPELFQQMEPDKIAAQIVRVMQPRLPRYTDEIMFRKNDAVWRATPAPVKARIYARVQEGLPLLVDALMTEASERIEELVDFKHMIVTRLETDRALLNRLFQESGEAEFRFIVRSGLYFGFLFGLVQLVVWIVYPAGWVLPAFGALVGYATNWIALNVIFRPLRPRRIGPWVVQGLFLRRQKEVASVWCQLVTTEIVNVRSIIRTMMEGARSEHTHELVRRHMQPLVDRAIAGFELPVELTMGRESLDSVRDAVGQRSIELGTKPFEDWHFNHERSALVESLLRERMVSMPPEDFQDLLRPCFQEDELKLILVGAVLGLLAGLTQLFVVFGGG